MPRLLIFAACEKAIVDQQTRVLSLISLLQDINVHIPPGTTPPPNSMIPMQWTIVASYVASLGDGDKQFEHRAALVDASGTVLLQTPVQPFNVIRPHRIISRVNGMPIGNQGQLTVKCFVRDTDTNIWTEMDRGYPINIKWGRSAAGITPN